MFLYHALRYSVAPVHQTAWVAVQTLATIAAFAAAGIYAWIASRQTAIYAGILAIEQMPILIAVEGNPPTVRNVGRGPALTSCYATPDSVRTIGAVAPDETSDVSLGAGEIGISDERLYFRDAKGPWYRTKIVGQGGHLYSHFEGQIADEEVPAEVWKKAPTKSLAEHLGAHYNKVKNRPSEQ
jgi:hypothetical protein